MQPAQRWIALAGLGLSLLAAAGRAAAQETAEPPAATPAADPAETKPAAPVEIPDEPKTVDPAGFLPEKLAAPVTAQFPDSSLAEIVKWLREEQQLAVLLDERALSEAGLLVSEPLVERLDNAPLYLLLNRLRAIGLAWFVEDDVVQITTEKAAEEHMLTRPYNVGDLIDAGFDTDSIMDTILSATEGPWLDIDGVGGTNEVLGDVMFVRQSDAMHHEVGGLLSALRRHGRRTFTLDPPQHETLRQKLEQNVSVAFRDMPLLAAVEELARQVEADIRLDLQSLQDIGIRDRQPVSLTLADRKLSTILQVLLGGHGLTWLIRDGVLWITTRDHADEVMKTAIFDVRDLCRDGDESLALMDAIQNQTEGPWLDVDGVGGTMTDPKAGVLIVRQTERQLESVLELLESYRTALLASKPRSRPETDTNELMTYFYRVETATADDLERLLPLLVEPASWRTELTPQAGGTILRATSKSEQSAAYLVPQTVLIIRQTRKLHDEIAKTIHKVESGDLPAPEFGGVGGMGGFGGGGFGGGGFGGGGFGGGFFSPRAPEK